MFSPVADLFEFSFRRKSQTWNIYQGGKKKKKEKKDLQGSESFERTRLNYSIRAQYIALHLLNAAGITTAQTMRLLVGLLGKEQVQRLVPSTNSWSGEKNPSGVRRDGPCISISLQTAMCPVCAQQWVTYQQTPTLTLSSTTKPALRMARQPAVQVQKQSHRNILWCPRQDASSVCRHLLSLVPYVKGH